MGTGRYKNLPGCRLLTEILVAFDRRGVPGGGHATVPGRAAGSGRGARFEAGPAWQPRVLAVGNLISGQNPASGQEAEQQTLAALVASRR